MTRIHRSIALAMHHHQLERRALIRSRPFATRARPADGPTAAVADQLNSDVSIGGFVYDRCTTRSRHPGRRPVVLGTRYGRFENETDAVQLVVELRLGEKALAVT